MSLAQGREFLAIPGPSVIPDRVLQAMNRPAVNIYEGALEAITNSLLEDLPALARTTGKAFIHIANGHGAWEGAIANTLSRGDHALALDCGRFGAGWAEMARTMGVEAEVLEAEPRRANDPNALEDRLRADRGHRIRAVLATQVDTASGATNDVAALRAAIDAAGHPALFMVDVIASQGCIPFEMDGWGVDVTVGGAQKGLMTPPGLAFTWANDKALAAHETAGLRTQYWDWTLRQEPPHYRKFCGTPPVHLLFALREAVDMILAEGLEAIWARHATLGAATRAAVEAWAAEGPLRLHLTEPAERADSVTVIDAPGVAIEPFRAFCERELGLVLGVGLGRFAGEAFRIGHMGWVNAPMLMGALGAAQTGMTVCGIPHGKGALDAAAKTLAGHFG